MFEILKLWNTVFFSKFVEGSTDVLLLELRSQLFLNIPILIIPLNMDYKKKKDLWWLCLFIFFCLLSLYLSFYLFFKLTLLNNSEIIRYVQYRSKF